MASPYHTWSDFIGFWIFVCFVGTILMVNVTPCAMERSQSSMLIELVWNLIMLAQRVQFSLPPGRRMHLFMCEEIFLLFLEDYSAGIPGQ
jgi:hypothetical protein